MYSLLSVDIFVNQFLFEDTTTLYLTLKQKGLTPCKQRAVNLWEAYLENTACFLDECGIRRIPISIKKPRSKQACSGLFYTYLMLLIANAQLLDDGSYTAGTNGSTTLTLFEYRISSYFLCFLVANFAENCCFCILYFNLFDFLAPFWHRIEIIYLS